jgi:hypothetical protein
MTLYVNYVGMFSENFKLIERYFVQKDLFQGLCHYIGVSVGVDETICEFFLSV